MYYTNLRITCKQKYFYFKYILYLTHYLPVNNSVASCVAEPAMTTPIAHRTNVSLLI